MNGYLSKQGYDRSLCITISVLFPSFVSLPAVFLNKLLVYLLQNLFEDILAISRTMDTMVAMEIFLSYSIVRVIAGISIVSVGTEGGDKSLPLKISTFVVTPPKF